MNEADYMAGCSGKQAYVNREAARRDLVRYYRKKRHVTSLKVYHCSSCHQFHIGSEKSR